MSCRDDEKDSCIGSQQWKFVCISDFTSKDLRIYISANNDEHTRIVALQEILNISDDDVNEVAENFLLLAQRDIEATQSVLCSISNGCTQAVTEIVVKDNDRKFVKGRNIHTCYLC